MKQFITYAQNREDVILDTFFKDVTKGTYVDIGANDPVHDSVTKHFYLKGWRGINVEPIASLCERITQDRPGDTNVCVGIADKPGELPLRQYANSGLSTFSAELQRKHSKAPQEKTAAFTDVKVPVITLKELFTKYPLKHIHFMKIDVEGFEYEVIAGNDWQKIRPEMLCIEANHDVQGKDWQAILLKNKYEKVWNDGLNDYYLAKESDARRKNFSYPQTLLAAQVIPYHIQNRFIEDQAKIRTLEKRLADEQAKQEVQSIRIRQLEAAKLEAEKTVAKQKRLKTALKLVVKAADNVIAARIEHLQVPKIVGAPPLGGVSLHYDGSDKKALLRSIRDNDMQTYYNFSKPRRPQKFYAYKAVHGSYIFAKRAARKSIKLAKTALKRSGDDQK
ncbi:MAG TPA: FkbM family methyltransferase [Candidatus Saccharimonas sp.]|nr:FkbM family methyltransferase [Candidatus Saccharimonas sp.]